jgi:hypothetical protein
MGNEDHGTVLTNNGVADSVTNGIMDEAVGSADVGVEEFEDLDYRISAFRIVPR